jgi:hypothetical protein
VGTVPNGEPDRSIDHQRQEAELSRALVKLWDESEVDDETRAGLEAAAESAGAFRQPLLGDEVPRSPDSLLWPDEGAGPWLLEPTWRVVDGRYECVGLSIRSYRRPGEFWADGILPYQHSSAEASVLNSSVLGAIPTARAIAKMRKQARDHAASEAGDMVRSLTPPADQQKRVKRRVQAQLREWDRGAERGPLSRQAVADVYTTAWQANEPALKAVQQHFHLTKSAAAKQVQRARVMGLIAETTRGVAKGGPRKDAP